MGAGKTTFIHALCKVLGVKNTVSSPTFAIINEYESEKAGIIYHMDWYRLKDAHEAVQAGVEDALSGKKFCIIEWPENAAALLPANTLHLYITFVDAATRKLLVSAEIK
jgi:tRNA threonylcarbamoyladenosine biosynthesis protein TsaE